MKGRVCSSYGEGGRGMRSCCPTTSQILGLPGLASVWAASKRDKRDFDLLSDRPFHLLWIHTIDIWPVSNSYHRYPTFLKSVTENIKTIVTWYHTTETRLLKKWDMYKDPISTGLLTPKPNYETYMMSKRVWCEDQICTQR